MLNVAMTLAVGFAATASGHVTPPLQAHAATTLPAKTVWAQPIERASGVLIAGEDHQLRWLHIDDDKVMIAEIAQTHSGPVWGGIHDCTAYVFDRYAVYAIDLADGGEPARLRWKVDDAESFQADEAGDPEYLTRILGVVATPFGACIVRSDGNLGMLSSDDGRLLWKRSVPKLRQVDLLSWKDTVALVYAHDGDLMAQVFELNATGARLRKEEEIGTRPLAKALTGDGLMITSHFAVWWLTREGTFRFRDATRWGLDRASTIAITSFERVGTSEAHQQHRDTQGADVQSRDCEEADRNRNREHKRPAQTAHGGKPLPDGRGSDPIAPMRRTSVWTIDSNNTLRRLDMSRGGGDSYPLPPHESWRELRVTGRDVIAIGQRTVCVIDARIDATSVDQTTSPLRCFESKQDSSILDVHLGSGQLRALIERPSDPCNPIAVAMWALDESLERSTSVRSLADAGHPTIQLWLDGRVWLFEGAEVRVYTLPVASK